MGRRRKTVLEVRVIKTTDRGFVLRWRDPFTDKTRKRKAKSTRKDDALLEAAALTLELRAGAPGAMEGWDAFRKAIEERYYPTIGDETRRVSRQVFARWQRSVGPIQDLAIITSQHLAQFESTIKSPSKNTKGKYLRQLKVMLRWGQRNGYIGRLAHIEIPRKEKGFVGKGTPKSDEQIAKLLAGIKQTAKADAYQDWEDCVLASLHSGLRVGEVLRLTWGRVVFRPSGAVLIKWGRGDQKSRKAETTPTTPEFADLLKRRRGVGRREPGERVFCPQYNGLFVSRRGFDEKLKAAAELVDLDEPISHHDLRRSFADRWSRKVTPAVLSKIMRCGIGTVMQFYAELESESVALGLLENRGTKLGPNIDSNG
jgi:integrase